MTEILDDCDDIEQDDPQGPVSQEDVGALFGTYSVLSPGVEIVLDGRSVSAPIGD